MKMLIVVDYQTDFVTGALGFPEAAELEVGILKRIKEQIDAGESLGFTLDTHGNDYLNTQEGRRLPIPHCMANDDGSYSDGWGLHNSIHEFVIKLNDDQYGVMEKNTFGSIKLGDALIELNKKSTITEIEFCGVVTNMCVISNAVIAKAALPEARIVINAGLCASFNKELHDKALDVMKSMQMDIINR